VIAIEISIFGGPEVLVAAERPMPSAGPGDVVVKVEAAGVNRPDIAQRLGNYPPPPGASDIPGLEIAGTIVETGADVTKWKIGDRVCALVSGGGYAEYCVAPAPQCLPIPAKLTAVEAAALPETFFTVWTNVFERGRLGASEWLLVHGGSSGIGTAAIQLARAFGAHAIATAGSDEKCEACVTLGAERAINYKKTDFVEAVREATGGRGVDVVLDMVGGDYTQRNLDVLAMEGRLVQIAFLKGPRVQIHLGSIMQRHLTLTGSRLRGRSVAEKAAIATALHERVWPLLESGAVKPVVYKTFPFTHAADAHRPACTSERSS
jgi:putative PIG3 family NAD(P)H quinone oxidoreductase